MVHARNVKPPFACARLTSIDESSVRSLPGFLKVVGKGNYVAVVCEREEQAIRAARQLKTTWEKPATAPFPSSENLFDYMRTAPTMGTPGGRGGRGGVAYAFRGQTIVAQIADVEVNRETGHVWAKLVCAHDCGFVVNPESLRHTVECGTLHGLSRALHEEVRFDTDKVTSVDWFSHPTLRHADVPERIDIVLVNGDPNPGRADLPPYGAGEASLKPMLAAIANAIHDATGVRIRRVPFRDERVLAALKAAGL
jgi:CO/xanthine dehydrogenase Mo-binding subunit